MVKGTDKLQPTEKRSGFAIDVAKLTSGALIAQLLGFLIMPILSRLYAPETFGVASLFTSIITVLSVGASFRYELAIMLPERDEEAMHILRLSLFFVLLTGVLSGLLVKFGGEFIVDLVNTPVINYYLWYVPFAVILAGAFTTLSYWSSRTKRFGLLSMAKITRSIGSLGSQLGGGLLGYASNGTMIGSAVFGQGIATAVLALQTWKHDRDLFLHSFSWTKLIEVMKRYRQFPIFSIWSALLNSVSWQLPTFLLGYFFSPAIVGYYAVGQRVLRVPMNLIGRSIGQVFFQRASEAKNEGYLSLVVEHTFERLVKLGLFPSLMLAFVARDIFIVLFGEQWSEAGLYVQLLSIWTFFWFISSPISTLFSVLERQDLSLYINILVFVSRLATLAIGGYLNDARLAITLFGLSGILVYGYLDVLLINYAGVAWGKIWHILLSNVGVSLPAALILLVGQRLGVEGWGELLLVGVESVLYFLYIIRMDSQLRDVLGVIPGFSKFLLIIGRSY